MGLDALMDVVFPVVPGWDVAGTVETVGIDTPEFEVGDEVVAYARKDVVHGGTFAELVTMSVRGVARNRLLERPYDAATAEPTRRDGEGAHREHVHPGRDQRPRQRQRHR